MGLCHQWEHSFDAKNDCLPGPEVDGGCSHLEGEITVGMPPWPATALKFEIALSGDSWGKWQSLSRSQSWGRRAIEFPSAA